jgi:hypothetical protein
MAVRVGVRRSGRSFFTEEITLRLISDIDELNF